MRKHRESVEKVFITYVSNSSPRSFANSEYCEGVENVCCEGCTRSGYLEHSTGLGLVDLIECFPLVAVAALPGALGKGGRQGVGGTGVRNTIRGVSKTKEGRGGMSRECGRRCQRWCRRVCQRACYRECIEYVGGYVRVGELAHLRTLPPSRPRPLCTSGRR